MATEYTDLGGEQNDALTQASKRSSRTRQACGVKSQLIGVFTTTAATVDGGVIEIGILPDNAILLPGESYIITEDLGTDISFTIGTEADDDLISTAISAATAGKVEAVPNALAQAGILQVDGRTKIIATVVDAGSIAITAAKDVVFYIAYVLPT